MRDHVRRIGSIHIAPTDQKSGTQTDALQQARCDHIHQPVFSENPLTKEALKALPNLLGNSDTLIVYRLDRLTRDEHTLTNFREQLKAMGVELIVTDDTTEMGGTRNAG